MEGDGSLTTAAECELRELIKDTGIQAEAGRFVFLMDVITDDPSCRNLEEYMMMRNPKFETHVPERDFAA